MNLSKNKVLGLDISTSITGACIVEEKKVIETYIWDTRNKNKFANLYEKAKFIKSRLLSIKESHDITTVAIEKPFMFFNTGLSTAKTMSILQNFNGMVSWMCCDIFQLEPEHITVREARKSVGISIKRGENSKSKVLNFVVDKYPEIVIEYTRYGNPKPGVADMCDSIIIALAGLEIGRKDSNT